MVHVVVRQALLEHGGFKKWNFKCKEIDWEHMISDGKENCGDKDS